MKTILTLILTAVAVALLSACSTGGELPALQPYDAPAPPVAARPATAPEPPVIDNSEIARTAYLIVVGPEIPAASESLLLMYANMTCDVLSVAPGLSLSAAHALENQRTELEPYQSGAVVGAVIGSGYCDDVWVG